jgi:NAD(P)H dehydrogenase (quinone)
MKILIVVAHPDPGSFNRAIADVAAETVRRCGHEVVLHDLYAEKFDPLLPAVELAKNASLPPDIAKHCADLASADGIVIAHPNWWGQPPAILKGWIDRVVRPGLAYEFRAGDNGEGVPAGLLKARAAVVFNTANTLAEREQAVFGDPLEAMWKQCVFDLCGVKRFRRKTFTVVVTSTLPQRQRWLTEVSETVREIFPPAGR